MKLKLLIAALLTAAVSTAIADTYVVGSDKGTSSDEPKLASAHSSGGCVYADKTVKPGDTIVIDGADTVLVCAGAPQGPVFYPLSASGAERVAASLPTAKSAGEDSVSVYKITARSAPVFTPVKAWNDGKLTFIALAQPYHGELPVVFALAEDGSRSLVNFQWDEKNSRFVVQCVLDRAILILGDKSVVVSRT